MKTAQIACLLYGILWIDDLIGAVHRGPAAKICGGRGIIACGVGRGNWARGLGRRRGTQLARRQAMRMPALFFLALPACYGEIRGGNSGPDLAADAALTPDAPPDAPAEIDARAPESIDSLLIAEATNAGAFTKISKAAYTSSLGDFTINVMTNQDSRDYKKIHPEDAGSHMTMLPGTLIVRQV